VVENSLNSFLLPDPEQIVPSFELFLVDNIMNAVHFCDTINQKKKLYE